MPFALAHLRAGNWSSFAIWYLPALSLLQVGGSLVEAVSGAGAGLYGSLDSSLQAGTAANAGSTAGSDMTRAGSIVPR